MAERWRNWSRELRCAPADLARARSTDEVAAIVGTTAASGRTVRPVGAGHSFTPLVVTRDVMVDISGMDAVRSVDHEARTVTVEAGIRLRALAEVLHAHGLALHNLGDIAAQTLAGATATGTHGTGGDLTNLSAAIIGVEVVDGGGRVHQVGPGDPRLDGLRVSLGALGVVTAMTLQVTDAYVLRGTDRTEPLDDVLDTFTERVAAHRHVEAYVWHHSDVALTRTNDWVDGPPDPPPAWRTWVDDRLLATHALGAAWRIARGAPRAVPRLNGLVTSLAGGSVRTDVAHRIQATTRDLRFTEMELCVPREHLVGLVRDVKTLVESEGWPIAPPMEVRTAAADTGWLSPAHDRTAGYLAVHTVAGAPHEAYFDAVWELARPLGARPHWGKRHPASAADLAPRYPRWADFSALRAQMDPDGVMANPYLDVVLGSVETADQPKAWPSPR